MVEINPKFTVKLGNWLYLDENAETYEEIVEAFSSVDLTDIKENSHKVQVLMLFIV